MDRTGQHRHAAAMGIGGRSILRVNRALGLAVGLLAASSTVALATVQNRGPEAVLTTGGEAPAPDARPEVLATGGDAPPPDLTAPAAADAPAAPDAGGTTSTAGPGTTGPAGPGSATTRPPTKPTVPTPPAAPAGPGGPVAVDTGLWVSKGNAPLRSVSSEAGWTPMAWSPDSRSVAMARRGEVVLLDPVSGARKAVVNPPNMAAVKAAFSPNGRSLAVVFHGLPGPATLSVVDLPTGAVAQLQPRGDAPAIGYTADGCLAYAGVGTATGITVACPGQPPRLIPLPDDQVVVAVLPGIGFAHAQYGLNTISLLGFDGKPLPGITGTSFLHGGMTGTIHQIVADPASGSVIWAGGHNGEPPMIELYATRPGGATATLSRCSISAPTASRNGIVAYAETCAAPGRWSLARRSPLSGAPQTLATFPYSRATTPLISPDGATLLFAVTSG